MNRSSAISAIVGILLVTLAVSAGGGERKASGLPENIRDELEYFVGRWMVEMSVRDEKITSEWTMKWAPHKACIQYEYVDTSEDGSTLHCTGLIGWNTAAKQLVLVDFGDAGHHFLARMVAKRPGVWAGDYGGTFGDTGAEQHGKCSLEKQGPDKFTLGGTQCFIDGKQVPDWAAPFRRIEP